MSLRIPLILVAWLVSAGVAADVDNGDDLHFEHCTGCHDETVYTRENRNVNSLDRLGKQVRFCVNTIGVQWFDEDVDDVVEYLNQAYYHF